MLQNFSDYSKMTEEELKGRSDNLFTILHNNGTKLSWFAKFCGVNNATVTNWKKNGAPIYAMRLMDYIIGR